MRVVVSIFLTAVFTLVVLTAQAQPLFHPGMGQMPKPILGVIVVNVPFEQLDSLKLENGVRVINVSPDSPAVDAGIQTGDLLIELNGKPIYSPERLRWLVNNASPGEKVVLKFYRDGDLKDATIRFGATDEGKPQQAPWQFFERWGYEPTRAYLGVQMQSMTDELRELFGASKGTGVLVVRIAEGSPAAKARFTVGDVIVSINGKSIHNENDIERALNYFDPEDQVSIGVIRDKKPQFLTVILGTHPEMPDRSDDLGTGERYFGIPHPYQLREPMERMIDKLEEFWDKLPEQFEPNDNSYH